MAIHTVIYLPDPRLRLKSAKIEQFDDKLQTLIDDMFDTMYHAKGVGLAANEIIKKVLKMAGVKDVWSKTQGNTANIYNTASATMKALNNLNRLKPKKQGEEI